MLHHALPAGRRIRRQVAPVHLPHHQLHPDCAALPPLGVAPRGPVNCGRLRRYARRTTDHRGDVYRYAHGSGSPGSGGSHRTLDRLARRGGATPRRILLGAALATKVVALSFVAPCLAWVFFNCFGWKRRMDRKNLAALLQAVVLCAIIAAPPYATAWVKTGNPVFPYFNDVFARRTTTSFRHWEDDRWRTQFSWHALFDVTFRSSKFLESQNGALGLSWILLILILFTAPRSMFTRPMIAALGIGVFFFLFTWSRASYIRYLVPAFPLMLFGFAGYLHALRREQPNLYRTVIGATVVSILSGVFLLPSSGYWHKNFCLSPLKFNTEAAEYIEQNAPARVMVEYLNRMAPGEPAAFFSNGIAGLLGRPYTSGSHTFEFFRLCEAAVSAEAVKKLMATHSIRYFVTPTGNCGEPNMPQLADFVKRYTEERFRRGCVYVTETKSEGADSLAMPGAGELAAPSQ